MVTSTIIRSGTMAALGETTWNEAKQKVKYCLTSTGKRKIRALAKKSKLSVPDFIESIVRGLIPISEPFIVIVPAEEIRKETVKVGRYRRKWGEKIYDFHTYLTPTGHRKLKQLSPKYGLSASEFIECIARGVIPVVMPEAQA